MQYEIGGSYPRDAVRGIVAGADIKPVWHALVVPPQKERAVCEHLKRDGVYAFFPSKERSWRVRGRTIKRRFPVVSTHVYAMFRRVPQWDVMKERRRLITGVFCVGTTPIEIPREIIKHLQGLTTDAEKLEQAKMELKLLQPGDRAEITEGPFSGFFVNIDKVAEGSAWFTFLTGVKGQLTLEALSRVIPTGAEAAALKSAMDKSRNTAKRAATFEPD